MDSSSDDRISGADTVPDTLGSVRTTAAAAFAAVGNEVRLSILHALWEAPEGRAPFTDLQRRVGTDDSGNFSYHLDKLVGPFVRETEDGYALRAAGEQVIRGILAGTVTADPTVEATSLAEGCPYCDGHVQFQYREETLTASCTECEGVVRDDRSPGTFMRYDFPPAGLTGRTLPEVLDAAHTLYDAKILPMMRGVCPECAGRVSVSFETCDDHDADAGDDLCGNCDTRYAVWSRYACDRCHYARTSAVWFRALNHPLVVSFYHEYGDLEELIPFRKLTADNAALVRDITEEVLDTDPYRFRVRIPLDTATLTVDLDEDLDLIASELEVHADSFEERAD